VIMRAGAGLRPIVLFAEVETPGAIDMKPPEAEASPDTPTGPPSCFLRESVGAIREKRAEGVKAVRGTGG
jgi:hypothetical protein